jgi:site-specific recombinase XerD
MPTVNEAIHNFISEHTGFRGLTSTSTRAYEQRLKTFALFAERRDITDLEKALTEPVIAEYFIYLSQTYRKESTAYAKRQAFLMFLRWAIDKKLTTSKPAIRLKKPPDPPTSYLTLEEAARLELAAKGGTTPSGILHLRDCAAFHLLAGLEIEIEVLTRLRVEDYDPASGTMRIGCLTVQVSGEIERHLKEYLFIREVAGLRSPYLFPSRSGKRWQTAGVRRAIQRHRQTSGLPPLQKGQSFHPKKWPLQERQIFLNTPVAPYDRSVEIAQIVVILGLHGGLRRAEMCTVKARDLDLERRKLYVLGKGGKARQISLDSAAFEVLKPIINARHPDQPLLLNNQGTPILSPRQINEVVRTLSVRAGIVDKKVTPHTLRHSFATHLLESGAPLSVVKEMLGHSRIEETMRYIHPDESQIREGIERLGKIYRSIQKRIIDERLGGLCSE